MNKRIRSYDEEYHGGSFKTLRSVMGLVGSLSHIDWTSRMQSGGQDFLVVCTRMKNCWYVLPWIGIYDRWKRVCMTMGLVYVGWTVGMLIWMRCVQKILGCFGPCGWEKQVRTYSHGGVGMSRCNLYLYDHEGGVYDVNDNRRFR